jgi:predicted DNA-binding transcriptional regulator AlpA
MTAPLVLTLDDLAAVLAMSPESFRRMRPALEAAGFPRRLPHMGARWSRAAVEAWIARSGEPPIAVDLTVDYQAEVLRLQRAGDARRLASRR